MKIISSIVLGVFVFLSSGLYAQNQLDSPAIKEQINVKAGEEFVLHLEANHTTGYQWRLSQDLDPRMLTLVGNTYEAAKVKRIGAGGQELWTFKALKTGRTFVFMKYVRPWEENKPAETKRFTIVIK